MGYERRTTIDSRPPVSSVLGQADGRHFKDYIDLCGRSQEYARPRIVRRATFPFSVILENRISLCLAFQDFVMAGAAGLYPVICVRDRSSQWDEDVESLDRTSSVTLIAEMAFASSD